jgi:hypothetical protein
MQFDRLVEFLTDLGAPFRLAPDNLLCLDIGWPVDREHLKQIRLAKSEALRRYLDDRVDEIREAAEDDDGWHVEMLLGGFIQDDFPGRSEQSTPRSHATLAQQFYGKPLPAAEIRRWTRLAISAAARPDNAAAGPVVYLISTGDPTMVKIGFSANFTHRLRSLRTASPVEPQVLLTVSGGRELETELHHRFKEHHIRREWYRLAPEIVAFIAAAAQR